MEIVNYGFGHVTIDGKDYDKDLVIRSDGSVVRRKKKLSRGGAGHTPLSNREMKEYLGGEAPSKFIVGTGKYGALPVKDGVRRITEKRGIELICEKTEMAIDTYLDLLSRGERVAALFHLTC